MRHLFVGNRQEQRHELLVLAALAMVPMAMVLVLAPGRGVLHTVSGVAGLVAGLLLMLATMMSYLRWRDTPDPRFGWVVVSLVVVTAYVLLNNGVSLVADVDHRTGWCLLFSFAMSTVALAFAVLALRARSVSMPDPLLVGGVVALGAAVVRVLLVPVDLDMPRVVVGALALCTLATHAGIGAAVMANAALPRWATWRLAGTLTLLAVGQMAAYGPVAGTWPDATSAVARFLAGVLWTSATYVMLRESVDSQRARAASLEGSLFELEAAARGARERLHEVQSTLAGVSSAAQLLADQTLPSGVRDRLERTIRSELARLERLLAHKQDGPALVDVDETLHVISDLHRARGRSVEVEASGAQVVGQSDALAEAVNILLDNAATHGGASGTRIAVQRAGDHDDVVTISVSDSGPGVPPHLRDKVFDWGVSRPGSPGQGIGLNLARRLVTEQGGSLTLAEPSDAGSSFVIRLPAVRRSDENLT